MISKQEIEEEATRRYPDTDLESWGAEREIFGQGVNWALSRPSEPKNFFDVYPNGIIGERDSIPLGEEEKRAEEWRKNLIAVRNQLIADGFTLPMIPKTFAPDNIHPEPKADPKEKELYSIKPLEWIPNGDNDLICHTAFGPMFIYMNTETTWRWNGIWESGDCNDADDGKRKLADHFNSKLKLCLNREL
jgi:hypothetical protein